MNRRLFLVGGALAVFFVTVSTLACGGGGDEATPTAPASTSSPEATAASGGSVDKAQLASDLTTLRAVLQDTIAKAQAGDVQGTRDAEGKGDDAIESIIKTVRPTDSALADSIEQLELDYEAQADSDNPDLTVIAQDAQDVLPLLDQVASEFNITQ